jgi:hypothetical protein
MDSAFFCFCVSAKAEEGRIRKEIEDRVCDPDSDEALDMEAEEVDRYCAELERQGFPFATEEELDRFL